MSQDLLSWQGTAGMCACHTVHSGSTVCSALQQGTWPTPSYMSFIYTLAGEILL